MRGALKEDIKAFIVILAGLLVVGAIGGFAYALWARGEREAQQRDAAILDCPNDRHRVECVRRVEAKHDDCYEGAKRSIGADGQRFDLRAYRRCLGVPMPFEGMTPDQVLKKGLQME